MRVLGLSLKADSNGQRMEGMLGVIARMKPAALAGCSSSSPRRPGPTRGASQRARAAARDRAAARRDARSRPRPSPATCPPRRRRSRRPRSSSPRLMAEPEDTTELERQVAVASPVALRQAARSSTAVALSRKRADAETVADHRRLAARRPSRDGAFAAVREALRRLDELVGAGPRCSTRSPRRRATLSDRQVLARHVRGRRQRGRRRDRRRDPGSRRTDRGRGAARLPTSPDPSKTRDLLRPVLRAMSEPVLGRRPRAGFAPRSPRGRSPSCARSASLGDRRAVPVIGAGARQPRRERAIRRDQRARRDPRARGRKRAHPRARAPGARDAALRRARDRPGQGRAGDPPAHARARGPQRAPAHARDQEGSHPRARAHRHAARPSTRCTAPPTDRSLGAERAGSSARRRAPHSSTSRPPTRPEGADAP